MEAHQAFVNEICPTTTQSWVKNGALLVDVREKAEVEQLAFDVPAIVHIPVGELESRYTELPKDKELVMVCHSGARSLKAAEFLKNQGYEHVVNMKYGILRWAEKGFPLKGNMADVVRNSSGTSSCC